jgi:RNA polymerase sigma-70 factor (ECF subfamily)
LAIAANRCRTALRQRPRNPVSRSQHLEQAVAASAVASRDLADELEAAVCDLREDYRLCFLLFYQEDLSCAEISTVMNCPEGTVKTWLHRARRELADRLRRRGVAPHVEYQLH